MVCLDVSACRARDSISRRANPNAAPGPAAGERGGVGVPGCKRPSTYETHFQAGQHRTWWTGWDMTSGLMCLDVRARRARDSISRRANPYRSKSMSKKSSKPISSCSFLSCLSWFRRGLVRVGKGW